MPRYEIHSCEQMIELIQQLGFLPLLVSGIPGYSAEEMADGDGRYSLLPNGYMERMLVPLIARRKNPINR